MSDLRDTMFSAPQMAALFSGPSFVQRLLDFEAALARAASRAALIPPGAAEAIAARCRADRFDLPALFRDAAAAGTPVVPLVRRLTDLVPDDAKGYVHWGATSQDAIDTAAMLQARDGCEQLIARLLEIGSACAALAEEHRHTAMAGRTLLQHAVPITFGLKAARWLAMAGRLVRRLRRLREEAPAVQFGGAAGTLAALGPDGMRVMELLAEELHLPVPDLPWHAERDRIAEIAGTLGATAGAMGKIAIDLALLAQTEVGEVSTGGAVSAGRSSTMPQKRNPVEATAALACARLAAGLVPVLVTPEAHPHERAAGAWQAEWQALPDLFRYTSGAIEWVHRALAHLEVDAARMRANLDLTRGLIMAEALTTALAAAVGRDEAYRLVQRAVDRARRSGLTLQEAAGADERIQAELPPEALARVFDVSGYLGSADAFIDRALAEFRALQQEAEARA